MDSYWNRDREMQGQDRCQKGMGRSFVDVARKCGCRIFFKEELVYKIMGEENAIQELALEMEEALK